MSDTRSDADPALRSSEAGSRASPLPQAGGRSGRVGAGLLANPGPARRLADFYETLTPASIATLGEHYAPDARFKDPFNEVAGIDAIRRLAFPNVADANGDERTLYQSDATVERIELDGSGNTVYVPVGFKSRISRNGSNNDVIER